MTNVEKVVSVFIELSIQAATSIRTKDSSFTERIKRNILIRHEYSIKHSDFGDVEMFKQMLKMEFESLFAEVEYARTGGVPEERDNYSQYVERRDIWVWKLINNIILDIYHGNKAYNPWIH
jgi:hypothetical protein